jgi:hypothetical protein
MSDRAADISYNTTDVELTGDANGPAQPARPGVDGFWEQAVLSERGLLVGAWALDPATGQGPAAFRIEWGRQVFQLPPNVVREDVARARQIEPATIGVLATLEVAFDPSEDLSETRIVAEWADGQETLVPPLRALQEKGLLRYLRFAPKDFYNLFQNPAFRCATPAMQAYGAACAMRMAGEDLNLWLAGAVVGIYRYIDQGVFPREQVERAIVRWKEIQPGQRVRATGIALRWATSMHLAAGYAHLEWGHVAAARDEFLAMNDYAARMSSWPQCLTNLGIGRCLAAILTIRLGERERALAMLDGAEDMFPAGVGPLKIWNFHMFEELRGALKVWQYNFVLKKYLEGEKLSHVLPPEFGFRLRDVSVVMAGLIARQRVPDWSYPGDIAA